MRPLAVTPGGSRFLMVTANHFIQRERDKHSLGLKRSWIGEPPSMSQLHHQAPRPDVVKVPFNPTRGAKAISPLGIENMPLQVPNFDANTNKGEATSKHERTYKKQEKIRLRQAAHKGNTKNHNTWHVSGKLQSRRMGIYKNGFSHARPQSKLNA